MAAVVALLLSAAPARATSITVTNNTTFTVFWLYTPTNPDLAGQARFTITNYTTAGFDLTVDQVMNTMPTSPDINARLVSFGFGLTPDATSFTNAVNGSIFSWGFTNFPGFQSVDVCGFSGNSCAGGANGGLNQGESQLGSMSIHVNGLFTNGATFSPVAAKFQTGVGSFELDSCTRTPGGCGSTVVIEATPEPASLIQLGTRLVGAAFSLRRRMRRA